MTGTRKERVQEALRKEISMLIQNGLKDVRVGFVTIMSVEISPDLKVADVHYSVLGSEKEIRDTGVGLKRATGFIRREVGHRVKLRYTPALHFKLDQSLDHSFHIDEVLKKIKREKNEPANR